MTCREVARRLAGYLDGAVGPGDHAKIQEHLESCAECRRDLECYRRLGVYLAQVEPLAPPADLALRIRSQASRERARQGENRKLWSQAWLVFENILQPLAVPATGGVVTTLLAFFLVGQSLLVGVPLGAVPNDLPTNLTQPARLESLPPFPAPGISAGNGAAAVVLLVEATLDARGAVVNYNILSGPDGEVVRRQLDQVLLFSRFRPQMSFGRPAAGGRVILSFSEIRVKG